MLTVTLTKGLPGSGKSTWAKELLEQNPNSYKRINKDELRLMLDNGNFSKDSEKFVLKVRDSLILLALSEGRYVIVDDTNLHPKHEQHIKNLVKGYGKVEIRDFTDVPIEWCIKRDLARPVSVGEKVIREMHNQFLKPKVKAVEFIDGLPRAVICDLDGTLCLLNGRNPYDASTCENDELNKVVASIIKGKTVLFTSGREDKYREQTVKFLTRHNILYENLWMRKSGDSRKDSIIKEEIYNDHIKGKYNIEFVLDDRNQVVELWRSLGLICLQVADGDF